MGFFDDLGGIATGLKSGFDRGLAISRLKNQISKLDSQRTDAVNQLGESIIKAVKKDQRLLEAYGEKIAEIERIEAERHDAETELEAIQREDYETAHADSEDQIGIDDSSWISGGDNDDANTYICTQCGTVVDAAHSFCMGCGKPVAEIRDELQAFKGRDDIVSIDSYELKKETDSMIDANDEAATQEAQVTAPPIKADLNEGLFGFICESCGEPMGVEDEFCMKCGTTRRK